MHIFTVINEDIQNDKTKFNDIVDSYYHKIYKFCYFKLHDKEDAEDCTQEVFALLCIKLSEIRNLDSLLPWLYKTANNYIKRYFKNYQKDQKNIMHIDDDSQFAFEMLLKYEDNFDWIFDNKVDIRPYIQKILEALSERELTLWYLYFKENKSIAEIKTILKISEQSVKSRIFRLKIKLHGLIQEELNDEFVIKR